MQQVGVAAVRMQVAGNDAGLLAGLHHDGACAIAPQNAVATIAPIGDTRQGIGTDDQHVLDGAALDETVGCRQRINKTAAYGLDIESRATGDAELVL